MNGWKALAVVTLAGCACALALMDKPASIWGWFLFGALAIGGM